MTKTKYLKPEIEVYQLSTEVLSMVAATVTTKNIGESDNQSNIEEGDDENIGYPDPFS